MKINEVTQPSAKRQVHLLQESWSNDPDQPFSEGQLQIIAEDVIRAESTDNWQKFDTIDSFKEWLDENWK